MTYYEERLQKLGITEELNQVKLWHSADKPDEKGVKWSGRELKPVSIFRPHEKGIEIIVYTIGREQPTYTGEGKRWKDRWSIIRHEKPMAKPDGSVMKYQMPKGQGSYPFFPPGLIDKFDAREKIKVLYLTEGFFKAFKGSMHGVDIVGLASITHLKNKENGGLHTDIIKLIGTCEVERVVWLTDGDCLDISRKALPQQNSSPSQGEVPQGGGVKEAKPEDVDLYKRPNSFYQSVATFKQLLDDHNVEKYFMHIDTDAIWQEYNFMRDPERQVNRDMIKGLDDILVTFPDKTAEIVEDLHSVSKNGFWFQRFNITTGMNKVWYHFRLNSVNAFILFHQERHPELKGKEFIYHGTRYLYDDIKGECNVVTPGDAKLYFRVGNDYYKWLEIPNQYKQNEKQFHERSKSTITDDHTKSFIKHIPKFEAFCNVPDHINYQPVIHNCFNVYCRLDHAPEENACTTEDFPAIHAFLHHIFGEKEASFIAQEDGKRKTYKTVELGYDYLQILYQQPWKKLPILCLVSRENNTGKSTFANFLRMMIGANVAIVGNADLSGDFNAHWATKSVVVCDETKIDKVHVIEKIKSLSTARKIWMNAKGKGQVELDCFIKFVLITNNEDNFIYAGDDDIRYWVIKVPVLKTENPGILDQFVDEMPAFLSYLGKRKLATENRNRMWFHPDLLKTDALKKVIQYSMPTIQKELIHHIREMFFDFQVPEILMTRKAIHKEFFNNKFEANYLETVLKERLKVDLYWKPDPVEKDLFDNPLKIYVPRRHSYPKWEETSKEPGKTEKTRVDVHDNGRPYVFKIEQFLTPDEIKNMPLTPENKMLNEFTANDNIIPKSDEMPFG